MLEMRPGRPEEVLAQKALWKAAFGDEGRYIDWFYECCGASADVLEVVEEGRLVGMLSLADLARSHRYDMEAAQALSEISENIVWGGK